MTEEELRAQLEEQLKRLHVQDVLVQTAVTLVNLAGRRLGLAPDSAGERDLDQAKLAIEGVRVLLPLLPAEVQPSLKDALSQLQMAFAREAKAPAPGQAEPSTEPPKQPTGPGQPAGEPARPPAPDEAERAKARSKIWVPPGSSS